MNISSNYISYSFDKSGKKQYQYREDFIHKTTKLKYKRIIKFCEKWKYLCGIIKNKLLKKEFNSQKEFECTLMIYILLKTYIRPGNNDSDNYGLTTLKNKHISLSIKPTVILDFIGKKAVRNYKEVSDPLMYNYIKSIKKKSACNSKLFGVSCTDLNLYLKSIIGLDYTCKDIRTFSANRLFIEYIKKNNTIKGSYDHVAKELCNTKYISRKSYIMNTIEKLYNKNTESFKGYDTLTILQKAYNMMK